MSRVSNKPISSPNSEPPTSKVPSTLHERLASDLSDSSTESGVAVLKKNMMQQSTALAGGDRVLTSIGGLQGGGVLNTNSTGSTTNKGTQDELAVVDGLDVPRRCSAGMIKVKLASASPQWDNKAEVEVDCENPDEVVDKMLQSIVEKFPPTAVITVEKGSGGHILHPHVVQTPVVQPQGVNPLVPTQGRAYLPAHPPPHTFYSGQFYRNTPPRQYPMYFQQPSLVSSQNFVSQDPYGQKKHSTASSINSGFHFQKMQQEAPKFVKEGQKAEVEWIEKTVEVPQISYVDKYEEVQQVQEIIKHVPKYETVNVPREVVKYVPKIMTKIVENVVEVPRGEKIPVMRPQPVDTPFVVPRFTDRNVPVVMGQYILPEIEETDEVVEVEVCKYLPYIVPVDVYVPLGVTVPVVQKGASDQTEHPSTNADPALLQHLMIEMNPHLQQLEMYNFQQEEQLQSLIHQSIQQAREHGVAPPQPITNAIAVQQMMPPSANATSSFPGPAKTGLSRSSSAGASGRQGSKNASQRITGMGPVRNGSQMPPTMMVQPPFQYDGYPPMMMQSMGPMQFGPPTLPGSQGFGNPGLVYSQGTAGSTSGMYSTLYGVAPTMANESTGRRMKMFGPGGMPTNGQMDKATNGRRWSRLTNPESPSRQPSVVV